jgi:hypothetical protein
MGISSPKLIEIASPSRCFSVELLAGAEKPAARRKSYFISPEFVQKTRPAIEGF